MLNQRLRRWPTLDLFIFRFLRFPEYFFANTYHMFIIHSSYLISGFGAGNIFLNILLMTVNYFLCSQHFYFRSILCFIMGMPPNILILYVITSKLTMSIKYIYISKLTTFNVYSQEP